MSPLRRAIQPSFSSAAAIVGSSPSSSAVARTSSSTVSAASSSPFNLRNHPYESVALMRARTLPLSPASSSARVIKSSASSSSSATMCACASACAAIVWRSLRRASRAIDVCALHVPDVVLLRAQPGADHRARAERVEVGDRIVLAREQLERLVDERPGAGSVAVPLHGSLSQRRQGQRLDHRRVLVARLVSHLRHLELNRGPVLESPGGASRDVARAERRAKLERAKSERCARSRTPRARLRASLP